MRIINCVNGTAKKHINIEEMARGGDMRGKTDEVEN